MKKLFLLVGIIILFNACQSSKDVEITFDNRFLDYVNGYTSGIISKKDNISIELASEVSIPEILPDELFSISPSIEGTLVSSGQTIVFSPATPLNSGSQYVVELALGKLIEVSEAMQTFKFSVKTIEQDFSIQTEELRTTDLAKPAILELNGLLTTADFEENEVVEKLIKADGQQIKWDHSSGNEHRFKVLNIQREDDGYQMKLVANGSPLNIDRTDEREIEIPSLKEFRVLSASVNLSGDTYVSIFFSDPIKKNQDLSGLLELEGEPSPRFVINGNEVQMYLGSMHSGTKTLDIYEGIKNSFGYDYGFKTERSVSFDPENPQLKLIGKGTILPSTDGMVIPFEAVNLQAVRIDIIKVRDQNIPQFLQVNNLKGSDQLKRVGKKIMTTTVDLSKKGSDLTIWNRYTLNLGSLMQAEKGVLYRVQFSFRPEDSVFPCSEAMDTQSFNSKKEGWSIYEGDDFDTWGNYYFRYPNNYRWNERENPCKPSYYNPDRFDQRNLMASDLGLIAKIGGDNSMKIFTTNMVTAESVIASIELLDFQLESLGKQTTDDKGVASFTPERRPFLVIAEAEGQKSYLKLDDGASLSMSNFDVSGERVRAGLKGFIYGERGVWRPGDNIFLSFMLEDKGNKLPDNHPVILEFRDPMNNLSDKQVKTSGTKGLYSFKLKTEQEDMTGNWQALVTVGNTTFNKTIKIETIKPNRLKINLELGEETIPYDDRYINSTMSVNWLTGLKGSGLKAETTLSLSQVNTSFDGYNNYEFDDQTKRYKSDMGVVFAGNTDEQGNTKFSYQLPVTTSASGALKATFSTKAFEPGGDFSINTKSVKYLPYQSFVGIKMPEGDSRGWLQTDKEQRIDAVVLDGNGKPTSRDNLQLKIYKLNWRWWWDQSDDYSLNYITSGNKSPVVTKRFSASGGKGNVSFQINKPEWGRYLAMITDLVSGHSSTQTFFIDWPGWAQEAKDGFGASFLQVNTSKKEYEVGDDISVTIPGSSQGRALVSVENGSKVVDNFWIQTQAGKTSFSFKATPEMAPNIYLHVTLLQPHAQTVNDLPIRLYGIVPLKVYDPGTLLSPELVMADELAPGKEVNIKVSEENGKAMSYTLSVVDEGLLDITNFTTPDAWNNFYKREAIGVKTWDLYDDVIGAYGGRLERLLAIGGGDEEFEDEDKKSDNRFKPVVQFMGPFYLEQGSTKTHTFTMPQYIGSVKTMVVAGLEGAYGKTDKATPVVLPLMVLGTLPRVTRPGEKIRLPVNLFKYKEGISNAKVTVKVDGVLKLVGAESKTVNLGNSTTTEFFDLEVDRALGKGKVTITATSGKYTSSHEINLESRAPNPPQSRAFTTTISAGKTYTGNVDIFGMPGTNDAVLEIASVPQINLQKRLDYLIQYPHGCIEQTTSSVFPQLYLDKVVELSNDQRIKIEQNIKQGIKRLGTFQTSDGGFAYWPGQSDPNEWGTNYGYHFLIEAQKRGYAVPSDLMRKLKKFQNGRAKAWTKNSTGYNDDLIQSYRLFTLALNGDAALSSMNRMMNTKGLSVQSNWKLAAAYAILGRRDVAQTLLSKAGTTPSRYNYSYTYGSSTRDIAMLLETYVYLGNSSEAFNVFKQLAAKLSTDQWMSTQTTAYCLLATVKFLGEQAKSNDLKASVKFGGKTNDWVTQLPIMRESLNTTASSKSISITNKGSGTLYVTMTTKGTPFPGTESAATKGISVKIKYRDQNGTLLDVSSLKQGQSFEANVEISNRNPSGLIKDVALSHIFPSGWEIENERFTNDSFSSQNFTYQDIRDDRMYTYFDLKRGQVKIFEVKLTATYAGSYYLPGVVAEAMYDAALIGRTEGKWVQVVE
ncbi:MAG: hypothetical protein GY816_01710 [Cytophagales bacterium]|nr:hypothetical protein [Cytophagales bacterium]